MATEQFGDFRILKLDLQPKAGDPFENGVALHLLRDGEQAVIVQLHLKKTHDRAESDRLAGVAKEILELLEDHVDTFVVKRD